MQKLVLPFSFCRCNWVWPRKSTQVGIQTRLLLRRDVVWDVWRGRWWHTHIHPVAVWGDPSAKADQSPTHSFDDGPAARGSNLIQNINFTVLGLDNGVWFSLCNPINFQGFLRLNQKEIHEYLRPSSQDQYDFSDGFHTLLTFKPCFKLNWGDLTPDHQRREDRSASSGRQKWIN